MNVPDITGRRATDRELRRRAEAELARQAADAANSAKTGFVAAPGHELRNPLQAFATTAPTVRCRSIGPPTAASPCDTGPGIAAEQLGRPFTPFDRLGRDTDDRVGLGLPLARGFTEPIGGTLIVRSELGRAPR